MTTPVLPTNVQIYRTTDNDLNRVQDAIITNGLNPTLSYLNAQAPITNSVYMGNLNGVACTAGTWTALMIDSTNTAYYLTDVAVSLIGSMLVVNANTVPTSVTFRLQNLNSGTTVWTSSPISKGTVNSGGTLTRNAYPLSPNISYALQVNPNTTGAVYCMANIKVAY